MYMVITSCTPPRKTQQVRLNTRVNFRSADRSKVGQFSVGDNIPDPFLVELMLE
jgi:hypothetical protein